MPQHTMSLPFSFLLAIGLLPAPLRAQSAKSPGQAAVQMIVTASSRHEKESVPAVTQQDVVAYQGRDKVPVVSWLPLRDDHAGLELAVVIDDTSNSSLDAQLNDLRAFIRALPASTTVLVGYAEDGTVQIAQNFTKDHQQAAKAVRLTLRSTGAFASPYLSLMDLLKRWPDSEQRHEILLISDGIDRFHGGLADPDVESAYELAQRHHAIVHTLFVSGVGHVAHNFFRLNLAQSYLGQQADETGGEAFSQGFSTPVSLAPYLDHLADTLRNQYLLTVNVKGEKKPSYQHVRVVTELSGVELLAPAHVYVPATP